LNHAGTRHRINSCISTVLVFTGLQITGAFVVLQFDFDDSLGYWVCSTSHALRRSLNAELAKEGITYRQWEVLARIALQGELSQSELADFLGIEAPTLVGILDRMERDGWLDRYCCPIDRRKKRIRATEKAEAVWARMVDCAHRVRALAREGLSQEDLDQLRSICARISTNLEKRIPATAEPIAIEEDA
jgi:MarR family transcriptional regulator for hemolysin